MRLKDDDATLDLSDGELASQLDAWAGAQPEPRPSRAEAARRLLAKALAEADQRGEYRATRVGPSGPVDEWRAQAPDDEDAAHRLGQHLKSRQEQSAPGYEPEDTVTLTRPDGEIVTVAHAREWIARLTGWRDTAPGEPEIAGE